MKYSTSVLSALVAFTALTGIQVSAADNMASLGITPATGVVTLAPHWSIGSGLAGFHQMSQDLGLTGGAANNFYSIKSVGIPSGGDVSAFTLYTAASGVPNVHADIGSKLRPDSYSALTSADPDLGYGSVNLYLIHHKSGTDYLTAIIPGSATASAVTDEKLMSAPGNVPNGVSGYFGLTFAAANLGDGLNNFYYFRTDPVTGLTKFGFLIPAIAGASTDKFTLATGGHNALAFTGTDVGYGTNQMYFIRRDPVTNFTVLGTINPVSGKAADIANLGSVYNTLTFVPGDVGFGTGQFYTTGTVNPTWQSVSFAAIADRAIVAGPFTVNPTASSALPVTLTVVAGSVGNASISAPIGGVFTVTPLSPGLITLQASQAGQAGLFEFNMLRQSFNITGSALLTISGQPTTQTANAGSNVTFTVTASGTTPPSYQWRKAGTNIVGNASATTATLALNNVQAADGASYDVVVTNLSGSLTSNPAVLTVNSTPPPPPPPNPSPTVTSTTSAAGTAGVAFPAFQVTSSQSNSTFSATGLPAGLSINNSSGVITGTPAAAGVTIATVSVSNVNGSGSGVVMFTIAAPTIVPIITSPSTAPATAGTPFVPYTIVATGIPTSYTATGLPPGLTINSTTGVISGTPTTAGTYIVTITATNTAGTSTAVLSITVAPAAVAPIITSAISATGTVGTPFVTYFIAATGLPTSFTAVGLPAGLSLNPLTGAINGTPTSSGVSLVTIQATNTTGTSTTVLAISVAPVPSSRIVNFSARALSGPGSQTLIMGFVVSGDGKNLLVRGIGPTLTSFGVPNALADPLLTVFGANGVIATNDDWQINAAGQVDGSAIAAAAARVGAFALPNGSKDSALLVTVNNGAHSTGLLRPNSTSGIALTEVYDLDTVLGARLINVSARMNVTGAEGTLIAGFVIAGNAPKTVLIRGTGPALSAFAVTGVLADPKIALFQGSAQLATNDNWELGINTAAEVSLAAAQVGAFPLVAGSKDAALFITLQPGSYTVQVTGVGGTTGVALVEVYDMQ